MSQAFIVENMTGEAAANVLNGNFTELYAGIPAAKKLQGVNANAQVNFDANTKIKEISVSGTAGAPVLRIGTTPNGQDILPDTPIGNSVPIEPDLYFQAAGSLYFTLSGGTISIRIDYQPNFY